MDPQLGGNGASGDAGKGSGLEGCATGAAGATRQPVYLLFSSMVGGMRPRREMDAATERSAASSTMQSSAVPEAAGLIVYSRLQDPN